MAGREDKQPLQGMRRTAIVIYRQVWLLKHVHWQPAFWRPRGCACAAASFSLHDTSGMARALSQPATSCLLLTWLLPDTAAPSVPPMVALKPPPTGMATME